MSKIQIQTTVEQLLDAVAQLPPDEIASLTEKIIYLRATHIATHVEANEADLLLQINSSFPSDLRHKYDKLIGKRQAESLTVLEHTELIRLTTQFEQLEFERINALSELARLRHKSLSALMDEMGIPSANHG